MREEFPSVEELKAAARSATTAFMESDSMLTKTGSLIQIIRLQSIVLGSSCAITIVDRGFIKSCFDTISLSFLYVSMYSD